MRKWQKSFSHRPQGAPWSQRENDKSHFLKSFSRRLLVIFFLSLGSFMVETAIFCSKMSWEKPSLVDSDPVPCSNVDDSVLAWKRPRLSSEPAAVKRPGRGSWQKPPVATVPISAGNGAGANHLVWHSISIDEPTLSLIKIEESEMTDYKRSALDPNRIQRCGCKGSCFTLFQPNQILCVCRLWHGLSDGFCAVCFQFLIWTGHVSIENFQEQSLSYNPTGSKGIPRNFDT